MKKKNKKEEEKGNTVFPFVGVPQTLFLKPLKQAPPLGPVFIRYVATLFRKDTCIKHKPQVTPDTPTPKRSFTDTVPVFLKTEIISFMGAQKFNLHDHQFDQDEAVRQAHFEKFKGKIFAQTTTPEWWQYRYFSALLLNILMERIANIQRGVPDMEEVSKPFKDNGASFQNLNTVIVAHQTPNKTETNVNVVGGNTKKNVIKNHKKFKVPKNPKEAVSLTKRLTFYQRRQKRKEKTKLRGLVR